MSNHLLLLLEVVLDHNHDALQVLAVVVLEHVHAGAAERSALLDGVATALQKENQALR